MIEQPAALLPPNATPQERALAQAVARISDVPVPLRDLWSHERCPVELLPWLAWAFSVDEWGMGWSEQARRASVRDAVAIHRRKGTVWAIKRVLANAGYGDARLVEGNSASQHDGVFRYNGQRTHGDPQAWANFQFNLSRPISREDGQAVRAVLESVVPVRCNLLGVSFTDAQFYNGLPRHDGSYNHGSA